MQVLSTNKKYITYNIILNVLIIFYKYYFHDFAFRLSNNNTIQNPRVKSETHDNE